MAPRPRLRFNLLPLNQWQSSQMGSPVNCSPYHALAFDTVTSLPSSSSSSLRSTRLLFKRFYQHSSPHAPTALSNDQRMDGTPLQYSRHTLMSDWHRAARQVSPSDLKWEGRDVIDAQYVIIKHDLSVESPERQLQKDEIISEYGLQARDLRSLDAHILDVRPSLLVCKRSIVLCTPIARCIIAPDKMVLIAADKVNPICSQDGRDEMVESIREVMQYLEISNAVANGKKTVPFELRALEAMLLITVRGFKIVSTELHSRVYETIPQLRFGVSPAELRDLMEAKRTCEDTLFSGRALQSAISAILSEDEDLAGMYLTDKANGRPHSIEDHQAAELLLEYYERRMDETNEASLRLSGLLDDVDNNISLVLASTRVKLQNLELQTAITTLALGAGTAIAGFFGMNLISGFEEDPNMFYSVTGYACSAMAMIMTIGWIRMVRNRRSQLFLRSQVKRVRDHESTGTANLIKHRNELISSSSSSMKEKGTLAAVAARVTEKDLSRPTPANSKNNGIKREDGTGHKKNGTEM